MKKKMNRKRKITIKAKQDEIKRCCNTQVKWKKDDHSTRA